MKTNVWAAGLALAGVGALASGCAEPRTEYVPVYRVQPAYVGQPGYPPPAPPPNSGPGVAPAGPTEAWQQPAAAPVPMPAQPAPPPRPLSRRHRSRRRPRSKSFPPLRIPIMSGCQAIMPGTAAGYGLAVDGWSGPGPLRFGWAAIGHGTATAMFGSAAAGASRATPAVTRLTGDTGEAALRTATGLPLSLT